MSASPILFRFILFKGTFKLLLILIASFLRVETGSPPGELSLGDSLALVELSSNCSKISSADYSSDEWCFCYCSSGVDSPSCALANFMTILNVLMPEDCLLKMLCFLPISFTAYFELLRALPEFFELTPWSGWGSEGELMRLSKFISLSLTSILRFLLLFFSWLELSIDLCCLEPKSFRF